MLLESFSATNQVNRYYCPYCCWDALLQTVLNIPLKQEDAVMHEAEMLHESLSATNQVDSYC